MIELGKSDVAQILAAPETDILPSQFADMTRSRRMSPEKRLALAVLVDGLYCLTFDPQSPYFEVRKSHKEAVEWAHSADRGIYSFLTLCELFDLDPVATKSAALRGDMPSLRDILGANDTNNPIHG